MGADATAAPTEANAAEWETSTLFPGKHPTSASSRPARHSPLLGNCGPSHLAAGSIRGLRDGPCGQGAGGEQGVPSARGEEVSVRRGEGGAARRRPGADRAAGVGEGRKAGEGGGRERGRKQCSRLGPGRVPLPNAATRVDFGASVPPPDAGSGAAGLPALHAAEAPAATGWLGRRNSWPVAGADSARPGRPAGTPPQQDPQAGCGWGGSGRRRRARLRRPNSAGRPGARQGGSAQAWLEEARPVSSARGSAPARGSPPDVRRGVGRGGGSRRAAPPAGRRGAAGGVSSRPASPASLRWGLAKDPRCGPPGAASAIPGRSPADADAIEPGPGALSSEVLLKSGPRSQH